MAQTLTLNHGYSGGGGGQTKNVEKSAGALLAIDETVAIAATNFLVGISIDASELEAIYINSTQDLTLKTNSSGSPQETIPLKANVPLIWFAGGYFAIPFAGDVTGFYFTNASGVQATVTIRLVQDPTP
jgi:hypothetical protein